MLAWTTSSAAKPDYTHVVLLPWGLPAAFNNGELTGIQYPSEARRSQDHSSEQALRLTGTGNELDVCPNIERRERGYCPRDAIHICIQYVQERAHRFVSVIQINEKASLIKVGAWLWFKKRITRGPQSPVYGSCQQRKSAKISKKKVVEGLLLSSVFEISLRGRLG